MRWKARPEWPERKAAIEKWHPWFAWHPVRVGHRDWRWFETVERQGDRHYGRYPVRDYWEFDYRPVPNSK